MLKYTTLRSGNDIKHVLQLRICLNSFKKPSNFLHYKQCEFFKLCELIYFVSQIIRKVTKKIEVEMNTVPNSTINSLKKPVDTQKMHHFSHFIKCTIQWHLAHSEWCVTTTTTTTQFQNISPPQKKTLFPLSSALPFCPLSSPQQLRICQLWIFHTDLLCQVSVTQHKVFKVHPCCSIFHYFIPFCG